MKILTLEMWEEAEKLQERTDYMLNSALLQVKQYKEQLEKCEAALEQVPKLVYAVILFAGRLMPKLPHEGPCTPESGCDGTCMEAAMISDTIIMAYAIDDAARAALGGK